MRLSKHLLPLVMLLVFMTDISFADCDRRERFDDCHRCDRDRGQDGSRFLKELDERDFDALRDFVNTKRTIDIAEKSCNLTISGDVRSEWRHLNERKCGGNIRGDGAKFFPCDCLPISRNDFDVIFNLRFDYVCDRAWAVSHLMFDNFAGVDDNGHCCFGEPRHRHKRHKHHRHERHAKNCPKRHGDRTEFLDDPKGYHGSGQRHEIDLKKAYIGYNLCCCGSTRWDVEVGRRRLYNIFDSKIQFLSRFDGIFTRYKSCYDCVGDYYLSWGGFVVDERTNHFAWACEGGLLDICETGFDFKYSFIHWNKYGKNRCQVRNPRGFRFQNSQFTLTYNFEPETLWAMPAKFYGAFLINHDVRRERDGTDHKHRQNLGWYAGFSIGEVVEEGDWALDIRYEVVQLNCMPDNDVSGVGRGNALDESTTSRANRGNTNYKGYRIEGLYAITNNLSVDSILQWSRAYKNSIGGKHHFSEIRVEAIYAF